MLRYILVDMVDMRISECEGEGQVSETDRLSALKVLLESLTERDLAYLRERLAAGRPVSKLSESGVRYEPAWDKSRDVESMLARGCGDIDDLAAWRAAELRLMGIEASIEVVSYERDGHTRYTCRVRRADGVVEDLEKLVGRKL